MPQPDLQAAAVPEVTVQVGPILESEVPTEVTVQVVTPDESEPPVSAPVDSKADAEEVIVQEIKADSGGPPEIVVEAPGEVSDTESDEMKPPGYVKQEQDVPEATREVTEPLLADEPVIHAVFQDVPPHIEIRDEQKVMSDTPPSKNLPRGVEEFAQSEFTSSDNEEPINVYASTEPDTMKPESDPQPVFVVESQDALPDYMKVPRQVGEKEAVSASILPDLKIDAAQDQASADINLNQTEPVASHIEKPVAKPVLEESSEQSSQQEEQTSGVRFFAAEIAKPSPPDISKVQTVTVPPPGLVESFSASEPIASMPQDVLPQAKRREEQRVMFGPVVKTESIPVKDIPSKVGPEDRSSDAKESPQKIQKTDVPLAAMLFASVTESKRSKAVAFVGPSRENVKQISDVKSFTANMDREPLQPVPRKKPEADYNPRLQENDKKSALSAKVDSIKVQKDRVKTGAKTEQPVKQKEQASDAQIAQLASASIQVDNKEVRKVSKSDQNRPVEHVVVQDRSPDVKKFSHRVREKKLVSAGGARDKAPAVIAQKQTEPMRVSHSEKPVIQPEQPKKQKGQKTEVFDMRKENLNAGQKRFGEAGTQATDAKKITGKGRESKPIAKKLVDFDDKPMLGERAQMVKAKDEQPGRQKEQKQSPVTTAIKDKEMRRVSTLPDAKMYPAMLNAKQDGFQNQGEPVASRAEKSINKPEQQPVKQKKQQTEIFAAQTAPEVPFPKVVINASQKRFGESMRHVAAEITLPNANKSPRKVGEKKLTSLNTLSYSKEGGVADKAPVVIARKRTESVVPHNDVKVTKGHESKPAALRPESPASINTVLGLKVALAQIDALPVYTPRHEVVVRRMKKKDKVDKGPVESQVKIAVSDKMLNDIKKSMQEINPPNQEGQGEKLDDAVRAAKITKDKDKTILSKHKKQLSGRSVLLYSEDQELTIALDELKKMLELYAKRKQANPDMAPINDEHAFEEIIQEDGQGQDTNSAWFGYQLIRLLLSSPDNQSLHYYDFPSTLLWQAA